MPKKLTISLVTFNGAKLLPFCLQSIREQTFQDFELVVFDNYSTDTTREIISRIYPEAKVIFSKKNVGFAVGHNTVICQTQSQYICALNQDVILHSDYFFHCIQWLESMLLCGAVQGKLLRVKELTRHPQSDRIDSCGIMLHPFFQHFSSLGENRLKTVFVKEQKVFGVTGTAPIYRMRALNECAIELDGKKEYFDEDFFMYKEDVDLAYRLQRRGWQSWFIPTACAYHIRTAKSSLLFFGRNRPEKVQEWSYRNHFFVLIKNISLGQFMRYAPGIVLYECAKAVYHSIRSPRMFFSALYGVMRLWKRMIHKRAQVRKIRTRTV